MKVVLQRVSQAQVTVDDKVVGSIQYGMVLLVGFGKGDTSECIQPMVDKVVKMRNSSMSLSRRCGDLRLKKLKRAFSART
jgi:D-Tyr-tRNAtyr deacylase